jgi:hypothetical protein
VRLTLTVGVWVLFDLELLKPSEDDDPGEYIRDVSSIEEAPPRLGFNYDPEDD